MPRRFSPMTPMTNSFEVLQSPEIDGVFVRCTTCSEIIPDEEKASHSCPELRSEQPALGLVFDESYESMSRDDRVRAIDEYERAQSDAWQKELAEVEKKCSEPVLRKLVHSVMVENILKVRKYREREYAKNDELRAKGVPLAERLKLVDKSRIDLYENYEHKLAEDVKHFRVKPIRDWLTRSDLEWARSSGKGLRFIIMINLERVYSVPQKKI